MYDVHTFTPTFGETDAYLLSRGVHYQLYDILGAHPCTHQGVKGVKFCVWAPSAKSVSLVGDFNHWDGRSHPMRSMGYSGVWEIFVPELSCGEKYKYEIKAQDGRLLLKADPFANQCELRPNTASVVADVNAYEWRDQEWIKNRTSGNQKLLIYEVHLGSWKHGLNYRTAAVELSKYCKEMGFTHIELMPTWNIPWMNRGAIRSPVFCADEPFRQRGRLPVFRRPYAPRGDWCHPRLGARPFPRDDFAFAQFDGTHLYDHEDVRKGFHPHWNTAIFNYGRSRSAIF